MERVGPSVHFFILRRALEEQPGGHFHIGPSVNFSGLRTAVGELLGGCPSSGGPVGSFAYRDSSLGVLLRPSTPRLSHSAEHREVVRALEHIGQGWGGARARHSA